MGNRFNIKTIKKICCATTAAVALLLQMTGTAYAAGDVNMPSEPNGTFEQANPITVNTDVTDTFESENDVDCYGFSISKPGSVTLRYSTYVYKYNPSWSVSMNVYRDRQNQRHMSLTIPIRKFIQVRESLSQPVETIRATSTILAIITCA